MTLNNKVIAIRHSKQHPEAPTLSAGSASLPVSTVASTPLHLGLKHTDQDHAVTTDVVRRTNPARHNNSSRRNILDVTTVLTIALPVVEAIPIAGGPMKAAIGGVLEVLKILDVSTIDRLSILYDCDWDKFQQISRNKEEIEDLKAELHQLSSQISAISAAKSSSVTALRDDLIE